MQSMTPETPAPATPLCKYCGQPVDNPGEIHAGGCDPPAVPFPASGDAGREDANLWKVQPLNGGGYRLTDASGMTRGMFANADMMAVHLAMAMKANDESRADLAATREQAKAAEAERDRLKAALQFYATASSGYLAKECGQRAREALAETPQPRSPVKWAKSLAHPDHCYEAGVGKYPHRIAMRVYRSGEGWVGDIDRLGSERIRIGQCADEQAAMREVEAQAARLPGWAAVPEKVEGEL